jgi:hypothetical protein
VTWRRTSGLFRFEKGTGVNVGGHLERILDGGEDAPLEPRDLRFIVTLFLAIFLLAGALTLVATLAGWT